MSDACYCTHLSGSCSVSVKCTVDRVTVVVCYILSSRWKSITCVSNLCAPPLLSLCTSQIPAAVFGPTEWGLKTGVFVFNPQPFTGGRRGGDSAGVTNPGSFLSYIPGLCDKAAAYVREGTPPEGKFSICSKPGGACWCCCSGCWRGDSIRSLLLPRFGTSLVGFVIKYADVQDCWYCIPAFQTTPLVHFSLGTTSSLQSPSFGPD